MGVSIESLVEVSGQAQVWLARFGANHQHYGDPYTGTLTIIRRAECAHIIGHAGAVITHAERRTLAGLLRERGMLRTTWERRRAGGRKHDAAKRLLR